MLHVVNISIQVVVAYIHVLFRVANALCFLFVLTHQIG